jgi:predicted transcriptional regulator
MGPLPPTPRFLLRLPPDLRAELERVAEAEHRPPSNLIVHALREWLAGRGHTPAADQSER